VIHKKRILSRAVNAEKRLVMVQNQRLLSEEKMARRSENSDHEPEVGGSVKEYELQLQRERQGAKERVLELKNQLT